MILWVALGAAAAACLACVGAFIVWRAAARHAEIVEKLDVRLSELSLRLERDRAGRRDDELLRGLSGLRDDIAILCTHVSSLTGGQLDIKRVVAAAMAKEVAMLVERLDEADGKAAERAHMLHERLSGLSGDADALARLEARLDALSRIEARVEALGPPSAEAADAAGAAVREGVARLLNRLSDMEVAGPRDASAPPPRRAPAVFDGGRVVSLIAADPAAAHGGAGAPPRDEAEGAMA
jgi:hypothetical protein